MEVMGKDLSADWMCNCLPSFRKQYSSLMNRCSLACRCIESHVRRALTIERSAPELHRTISMGSSGRATCNPDSDASSVLWYGLFAQRVVSILLAASSATTARRQKSYALRLKLGQVVSLKSAGTRTSRLDTGDMAIVAEIAVVAVVLKAGQMAAAKNTALFNISTRLTDTFSFDLSIHDFDRKKRVLRRPRTHRVYSRRICATRVFLHGRTTEFVPHTDVPFPVYSDAMVERLCGTGKTWRCAVRIHQCKMVWLQSTRCQLLNRASVPRPAQHDFRAANVLIISMNSQSASHNFSTPLRAESSLPT
ncbi:hypothetical protein IG631_13060 [Alternaria alternata]|nr:hypothetical protein IG631_13060 [Alternaria alternata]